MKLYPEPAFWGPDEQVYRAQGLTVRSYGVKRGFRLVADRFVSERAEQYPSPLRWLWILLVALTSRYGQRIPTALSVVALPFITSWVFQSWWAGLLSLSSPLVLTLGRRALQDVTISVVTVLAFGFSLRGDLPSLAITVFALLALKEAAVLFLPALATVALFNAPLGQVLLAFGAAVTSWLVATRLVVGPLTWKIFRSLSQGHANPYAEQYQSGGSLRLVVDLVIASPLFVLMFVGECPRIAFPFVALAVGVHGLSKVNNVRTILAVDLVMRGTAGVVVANSGAPWWGLSFLVLDAFATHAFRNIYDPTTVALCQALRFIPSPKGSSDGNPTVPI